MDMQTTTQKLERARTFPKPAYDFVRAGLAHTCQRIHGDRPERTEEELSHHVSGAELCDGLRELAIDRYGLLARTVLRRWGLRKTEDFGLIVYALIEHGELRSSPEDSLEDFCDVFESRLGLPSSPT